MTEGGGWGGLLSLPSFLMCVVKCVLPRPLSQGTRVATHTPVTPFPVTQVLTNTNKWTTQDKIDALFRQRVSLVADTQSLVSKLGNCATWMDERDRALRQSSDGAKKVATLHAILGEVVRISSSQGTEKFARNERMTSLKGASAACPSQLAKPRHPTHPDTPLATTYFR